MAATVDESSYHYDTPLEFTAYRQSTVTSSVRAGSLDKAVGTSAASQHTLVDSQTHDGVDDPEGVAAKRASSAEADDSQVVFIDRAELMKDNAHFMSLADVDSIQYLMRLFTMTEADAKQVNAIVRNPNHLKALLG